VCSADLSWASPYNQEPPPYPIRNCIFGLQWLVCILKSEKHYLGSLMSLAKGERLIPALASLHSSFIDSYLVRITQNFRKGYSNMEYMGRAKGIPK